MDAELFDQVVEILVNIVLAVLAIVLPYILNDIKKKLYAWAEEIAAQHLTTEQFNEAKNLAREIVIAVYQKNFVNEEAKLLAVELLKDFLEQRGIELSDGMIDLIVESAYGKFKVEHLKKG